MVLLLDYVKFFDMFHPDWVRDFLIHSGFDLDLVHTIHHLYTNLRRRIKLGRHYGPIFRPTNGMAAGDSMALMVALAFVSTTPAPASALPAARATDPVVVAAPPCVVLPPMPLMHAPALVAAIRRR